MKIELKEQLLISIYDFDEHIFQFVYDVFFQKYDLEYWEIVKLVSDSIIELFGEGKISVVSQKLSRKDKNGVEYVNVDAETLLNESEIKEWLAHPKNWDRSSVLNQDEWVVVRNIEE